MKRVVPPKDERDLIMSHIKSIERNLSWLSEKTAIPYHTLYSILARKERALTEDKKTIINKILNTNI
jgi:uncharacterized protein (UPF0248 family)